MLLVPNIQSTAYLLVEDSWNPCRFSADFKTILSIIVNFSPGCYFLLPSFKGFTVCVENMNNNNLNRFRD